MVQVLFECVSEIILAQLQCVLKGEVCIYKFLFCYVCIYYILHLIFTLNINGIHTLYQFFVCRVSVMTTCSSTEPQTPKSRPPTSPVGAVGQNYNAGKYFNIFFFIILLDLVSVEAQKK